MGDPSMGRNAIVGQSGGPTAVMAALRRISNDPYQCVTEIMDIHPSANQEKLIPQEWSNNYKNGVTHEFIEYADPGGADAD